MNRKESLIQLLEQTPNDIFLNYALAMELQSEGLVFEAIERLEWIRINAPDYLATYYQLAALYQTNDKGKAIEVYQQGIVLAKSQGNNKTEKELISALELFEFE
jgi:tetratricopeptide (TPR) repeat protein